MSNLMNVGGRIHSGGDGMHTLALRRRHSSQAREVYFLAGRLRRALGSSAGVAEDIHARR